MRGVMLKSSKQSNAAFSDIINPSRRKQGRLSETRTRTNASRRDPIGAIRTQDIHNWKLPPSVNKMYFDTNEQPCNFIKSKESYTHNEKTKSLTKG